MIFDFIENYNDILNIKNDLCCFLKNIYELK